MEDMHLKKNAFIYITEDQKKSILIDTYSGKKYNIPFIIARSAQRNQLDNLDIKRINDCLMDQPIMNAGNKRNLAELRLLLTNRCNFNCSYCYADQGSYGMQLSSMTSSIMKESLNYFFSCYDEIRQISFFGGEPLLSFELIKETCDYITKNTGQRPAFSMVTNGYLLNDEIAKTLSTYNFSLIVSLDGPKNVNDIQRIYRDGKGTFDRVDYNIKKYKEFVKMSIEATYTKNHENASISRDGLYDFLRKTYGLERIIINDVVTNNEMSNSELMPGSSWIEEEVTSFFERNDYSYNDFICGWVRAFATGKYNKHFCGAGRQKNAVDMFGNIYPCHLFVGEKNHIIGHKGQMRETGCVLPDKNDGKCIDCMYKLYCFGCIHEMLKGRDICSIIQRSASYFLRRMAELFLTNRDEYNKILEGCTLYARRNHI